MAREQWPIAEVTYTRQEIRFVDRAQNIVPVGIDGNAEGYLLSFEVAFHPLDTVQNDSRRKLQDPLEDRNAHLLSFLYFVLLLLRSKPRPVNGELIESNDNAIGLVPSAARGLAASASSQAVRVN